MSDQLIVIKTDKKKRDARRQWNKEAAEVVYGSAYEDLAYKVECFKKKCNVTLSKDYNKDKNVQLILEDLDSIYNDLKPLLSFVRLLDDYDELRTILE